MVNTRNRKRKTIASASSPTMTPSVNSEVEEDLTQFDDSEDEKEQFKDVPSVIPATPPPPLPEAPFGILNPSLTERFFKYQISSRKIVQGKTFQGTLWEKSGIADLLRRIDISSILTPPTVFYPKLIRQFYVNFHVDDFGDYVSIVKGREVTLNHLTLMGIFRFNYESRVCPFTLKKMFHGFPDVSGDVQLKTVLGVENLVKREFPSSAEVTPIACVLMRVLFNNINPRSGGHSQMTCLDLILASLILLGKEFDFAEVVLRIMMSAVTNKERCLPYGCLLTKVFERFGVNLDGEEDFQATEGMDISILGPLNIKLLDDGALVRVTPPTSSIAAKPLPKSATSTDSDLLTRIADTFDKCYDKLKEKFVEVRAVKTELQLIRSLLEITLKAPEASATAVARPIPGRNVLLPEDEDLDPL